jgi:hypothetical protein
MQQAVHRRRAAVQTPRRIAQAQAFQHHGFQHQPLLDGQGLQRPPHPFGLRGAAADAAPIASASLLLLAPPAFFPGHWLLALPLVRAQAKSPAHPHG